MGTEKKVICYLTETLKCMKSWGIHITPTFFSLQYIKSRVMYLSNFVRILKNINNRLKTEADKINKILMVASKMKLKFRTENNLFILHSVIFFNETQNFINIF